MRDQRRDPRYLDPKKFSPRYLHTLNDTAILLVVDALFLKDFLLYSCLMPVNVGVLYGGINTFYLIKFNNGIASYLTH